MFTNWCYTNRCTLYIWPLYLPCDPLVKITTKLLTAPFQPMLDGAVKVRTSRRGKKDVYSFSVCTRTTTQVVFRFYSCTPAALFVF